MKGDMVQKIQILDGNDPIPGLVNLDGYSIEDDVVSVPGLNKTVPIRNGVKKIPTIEAEFKIERDSEVLKYFEDWYYKKEYKDLTIKKLDAAGKEYARELWPNTECSKLSSPSYDATAPTYSNITTSFLPEDIIPIGGES